MRFLFLFLALVLFGANANAEEFSYDAFAQLPVQHEGRIKPLDTFARSFLYTLSGKQSLNGKPAEAWLAEALFDPSASIDRPVFRIFRPQLLDLPERVRKYYSYAEIAPALQRKAPLLKELSDLDEKDWSEDQKELMRIQDAATLYQELLRSFSFILPLNLTLPPALKKNWRLQDGTPLTLEMLRGRRDEITAKIKDIIYRKGDELDHYTEEERAVAILGMNIEALESAGRNNAMFRIAPGPAGEEWISPWALNQAGNISPRISDYFDRWKRMAVSYEKNDAVLWNTASGQALVMIRDFAPAGQLSLEVAYNEWSPLRFAMALYLLALFAAGAFQLRPNKTLKIGAGALLILGGVAHIAAITIRILILLRPPVSTLHESILFVALIAVLISGLIEFLRRDGIGFICAALSGFLLLFIAEAFTGDDSLKMLTAVLNTNFWLGTHVIGITSGYGWCIIVSLLAHIWLMRRAFGLEAGGFVMPVKILALIGLLFTAIGTILGGIWADQSWGRFWGWDPKENGALLIVLWLIWILHGQIGGQIGRTASMALYAALSIVVALAWFGVNLLSVGLHSYGFISGIAVGLGLFCTAEAALIGFLYWRIKRGIQHVA